MSESRTHRATPPKILSFLLRPIVRFAIRHSLTYREFTSVLKRVYISLSEQELIRLEEKPNSSRISAMTGLPRYDVTQILSEGAAIPEEPISVTARVVGQWENDKRFTTKGGEPRVLECDGVESEFYRLVDTVSTHINPLSVLFELQRSGSVIRTKKGAKLVRPTVVRGKEPLQGYELLSRDIATLIQAAEENIEDPRDLGNLHHRTTYDNIYYMYLPRIRQWLVDEGRSFHRRARDFISQFDKDINPDAAAAGEKAGAFVAVGSFSVTSPVVSNDPPIKRGEKTSNESEAPWKVFSY